MKKVKRLAAVLLAMVLLLTSAVQGLATEAADDTAGEGTTFNVTVEITDHGSLQFTGKDKTVTTYAYDEGETVSITASPASGYALSTVSVLDEDNKFVEIDGKIEGIYDENTGDTELTFNMPACDIYVYATFELEPDDFSDDYIEELTEEAAEIQEEAAEGSAETDVESDNGAAVTTATTALSLASYSVSRLASGTTTFTAGTNHHYGSYSTYEGRASWNGSSCLTFCVEPSKNKPQNDDYSVTAWTGTYANIAKAICYYGYGGPGFNSGSAYDLAQLIGGSSSPNYSYCYAYTHLMLSWVYDGMSSDTDAWKGLESGTIEAMKNFVNNYYSTSACINTVPSSFSMYLFNTGSSSTQTECFWYVSPNGEAYVQKVSSSSTMVSNSSNYSLAGAVYGVYSGSTLVATTTTDSSGVSNKVSLEPGSYTVKEITASKGYTLDTTSYPITITSGNTIKVTSTEKYEEGSIRIYKYSDNTSITAGNSEYSVIGAVFGVYKTEAGAKAESSSDLVGTITINKHDTSNDTYYGELSGLAFGTYYIKETKESPGYTKDAKVRTAVVNSSSTPVKVEAWEPPLTVTVELEKEPYTGDLAISPSGVGVTDETTKEIAVSNASLEGAVYGIFPTYSDAQNETNVITTITTDADGEGTAEKDLPLGTYYAKEITAPAGYVKDDTVFTVNATNTVVTASNSTVLVQASERMSSGTVQVIKTSSDPELYVYNAEVYSLAGAVYGVYYDKACSPVNKAGTITTDENGIGTLEGVLCGTVYVVEEKAPENYELDTTVYEITVTTNETTTVESEEEPTKTTIWLYKGPMNMLETGAEFTKDIPSSATSVVFTAGKTIPSSAIDVSYAQNEGVMAWLSGTTWYVQAADSGTIYFNFDSSCMFAEDEEYKSYGYTACASTYGSHNLTSIDFGSGIIDTSYCTDMSYMFADCGKLKSLTLTEFDTSEVTNMNHMFTHSYRLAGTIDLSSFDTSKVTNMNSMFAECYCLDGIKFSSKFNTSKVTNFYGFVAYTCFWNDQYQTVINNIEIDSAKNLGMFFAQYESSRITHVDNMTQMTALNSLNFSNWSGKWGNVTNMDQMFYGARQLYTVTNLEIGVNVSNTSGMFCNCVNLGSSKVEIAVRTIVGSGTTGTVAVTNMFTNCGTSSDKEIVLNWTSASKSNAQKMIDNGGSSIGNRLRLGTVELTAADSTSSTMMASSALQNIVSGIKSVFTAAAEMVSLPAGSDSEGLLSSLSLLVTAEAADGETDLTNAIYIAYTDSACTEFYAVLQFDELITDPVTGAETARYILEDIPVGLTLWVKEDKASTGYDVDPNVYKFDDGGEAQILVDYSEEIPEDNPDYGSITIHKSVTNGEYVAGIEMYSMEGIKYNVYSDSSCTNKVHTFTLNEYGYPMDENRSLDYYDNILLNSDGTATTFYIKEDASTVPEGLTVDTTVYDVAVASNAKYGSTNVMKEVTDSARLGMLRVYKKSSDTETPYYVVDNSDEYDPDEIYYYLNDGYSLAGAEYTLYTDESCSEDSIYKVIKTTNYILKSSTGYEQIAMAYLNHIPLGTYWMVETKSPDGFALNSEPIEIEIKGTTQVTKYCYDDAKTGNIEIIKDSDLGAAEDLPDGYSVEGATFGIYKSKDDANNDTNAVDYVSTDSEGKASKTGLPLGTYYVKETEASDGHITNDEVFTVELKEYSAQVSAEDENVLEYTVVVPEEHIPRYLKITKKSSDTDATSGNSYYSFEDITYGIFTDESCDAKYKVDTITLDEDGVGTSSGDLTFGTYWVKEITVPSSSNYQISEEVKKVTLTEESDEVTAVTFTNTPDYGKIRVYKNSSDRDLTDLLDNYSLSGAEYSVYGSESDAEAGKNAIGICAVGEDLYSNYVDGLAYGTYYVKETKPATNYELDDTIYTVAVTPDVVDADQGIDVDLEEKPTLEPVTLRIEKESAQENAPGPLSGTQFTIQYYDGYYETAEELQPLVASRFWVIETQDVGNGVYAAELTEEYLVDGVSESLFYDEEGNIVLPVGTYTIDETLAPELYSLNGYWYNSDGDYVKVNDDNTVIFHVLQDETTGQAYIEYETEDPDTEETATVTFSSDDGDTFTFVKENMALGSIQIVKLDEEGNALEGITYELYVYNELTDEYEYLMSGITDGEGAFLFDELEYGTYKVVETSTQSGLTLLAEPIIVTIPVEISLEEAEETGADIDKAYLSADGSTCYFVDLTYTITDSPLLSMPLTGAQAALPIMLGVAVAVIAFGLFMMLKRRRVVKQ